MKGFKLSIILALIIVFSFCSSSYGDKLELSGESYILIDSISGRVLYEKNAHKKMPMASTTKIMTALIALEKAELNEEFTIPNEAVGVEGSSIYLREKEKISLEDILYGLMLRSGNDASVAIALHISDSMDDFIKLMNDKAKTIGALNTNFTNPHGLHNELHYSTAYDLALITKTAFSYLEFAKIMNTKSYISNREANNYFYNKNKTLWEYKGGDGGKTGYTMRSGRCLVSSASRNNMRLIAVSLNARDWFRDNYKLLDYGFENYKNYLIYDKNQFMGKTKVNKGDKEYLNLVTEKSLFYPIKEEEKEKISISIEIPESIYGPVDKGDVIGYIYTYIDGILIDKSGLVGKTDIKNINFIDKILHKFRIR